MWSMQKIALPALPWHSPRTILPFLVCPTGSGGRRTVQRSSCLWGLACPWWSSCSFVVPGGTGSSAGLPVKVVICHATLWQRCCLYSEGPCDLWCYKSWKTPSSPFIYNWKHNNWLQCQLKKAGSTLGNTHTRLCAHTCIQPPTASQAVLCDLF